MLLSHDSKFLSLFSLVDGALSQGVSRKLPNVGCRYVECYDDLDDEWLSGQPAVMRTLLGREDFLNTTGGAYAGGMEKLGRTFVWART